MKKICPLSLIGNGAKVIDCLMEECMFWDINTNPPTCLLALFFNNFSYNLFKEGEDRIKMESHMDSVDKKERENRFPYG